MDKFNIGDTVRVTWVDEEYADGTYKGEDQGFLILEDRRGRIIPCSPAHVKTITKIDS